jgi:hypothetical protein
MTTAAASLTLSGVGRVRQATLFSALIVLACGAWFVQTVFWPSGGTATDLRPLFPILVAFVLLGLTWLGTIWSAAVDAWHLLRRGDEPHD